MAQDDTHTNTPRSNARRNEREGRTLETPERRRIPQGPPLDLPPQPFALPAIAPIVGPVQFDDPFQNNYAPASASTSTPAPAPVYNHLPAHLAQALAQLPPLQPVRRGRGRAAPTFTTPVVHHSIDLTQAVPHLPPLPSVRRGRGRAAPAPTTPVVHNHPTDLTQGVAHLPPLQPIRRGRDRAAHTDQNLNWAPVQPAIPPVSLKLENIYLFIYFDTFIDCSTAISCTCSNSTYIAPCSCCKCLIFFLIYCIAYLHIY